MFINTLLNTTFALCDGILKKGDTIGANESATIRIVAYENVKLTYTLQAESPITLTSEEKGILNVNCDVAIQKDTEDFNLTNHCNIFNCIIKKGSTIEYEGEKIVLKNNLECYVLAHEMQWLVHQGDLIRKSRLMVKCVAKDYKNVVITESSSIVLKDVNSVLFEFRDNEKPIKFTVDQDGVTYKTPEKM